LLSSCAKEWLDVKSDDSFVVPTQLSELQALLDNTNILARNVMGDVLEISTDNVELTETQWKAKAVQIRNAFVWANDINEGLPDRNWTNYYGQIYYANTVLEGLNKLDKAESISVDGKNVAGQAYFYRAWAHFNLMQLFAKQYAKETAGSDLGIPLRKESLLDQSSVRATVQECYDFIISDMASSLSMLPELPKEVTRPSKWAGYAFMARLFLQMENYRTAKLYADSAIAIKADLLDFKNQNSTSSYPFRQLNEETIFYQTMSVPGFFVNMELFKQYTEADLRKKLFFRQSGTQYSFKGSYANAANFFSGLASDEVLLIRAECNARLEQYDLARKDLLHLLENRYETMPVFPADDRLLLDFILTERRKELLFRGLRWLDLKRLNRDEKRKVVLTRNFESNYYELLPNSSRYVFAIPTDVILNNPEIKQNERD